MAAQDSKKTAESSLKDRGNACFSKGQYKEAEELYSRALEEAPQDAALYSNRAAARLKLGAAHQALEDAEQAVQLRPDWEKAHFRRGCALEQQELLEQALQAFNTALQLNPGSRELSNCVRDVGKKVRASKAQQAEQQAGSGSRGAPAGHGQGPFSSIPAGTAGLGAPDSWARGLSTAQQYEWLVDCYRMRVDDDYAWGGGDLHGLYDPEASGESVAEDFLVFCKLAAQRGVVPKGGGWSWAQLLRTAEGLLPYAFEKSDAQDKWGGENVFAAMMGGRSLRATGEVVYGQSCMAGGKGDEEALEYADQVWEKVGDRIGDMLAAAGGSNASGGSGSSTQQEAAELFADVGGPAPWRQLVAALRTKVRGGLA